MHTCIYTGLVTYNIELHHFRIGDEINIKGDKQAPIIELELLSILFENLYTDFRRSSANVGILLDTNILLALYGLIHISTVRLKKSTFHIIRAMSKIL